MAMAGPHAFNVNLDETACLTVELLGSAESMWVVDPDSSGWEIEDFDPVMMRQRFRTLPGATEAYLCVELEPGMLEVKGYENGEGPFPTWEWPVMVDP